MMNYYQYMLFLLILYIVLYCMCVYNQFIFFFIYLIRFFYFFFFFKQKTAYEMELCWSSDVCSSDLPVGEAHAAHLDFAHLEAHVVGEAVGREEGDPVLVSLAGLDEGARRAFEVEGVGDGELGDRKSVV